MRRVRASRLTRIEEKRTKKQLYLVVLGIISILILILTVGIPLLVRASVFIGNLKTQTPLSQNTDTTAPVPPTLSSFVSATNSAQLKVEGYAEPESNVTLYRNGNEVKSVLIPEDGSFSFAITLEKGTNTIYATAKDQAGNESALSKEQTVDYKNAAPKLDISDPEDGKQFGKQDKNITVKGTTDPGASIWINDRFVAASDDGSFSFKLSLNPGDNEIKVVTKDQAGNTAQVTRKVTYSEE